MAIITKVPEWYARITSYSSSYINWYKNSSSREVTISRSGASWFTACAYRFSNEDDLLHVLNSASLEVRFQANYSGSVMEPQTVQCSIFKATTFSSENLIASQQVTLPGIDDAAGDHPYPYLHTFSFESLSEEVTSYVYFVVSQETASTDNFSISHAVASADLSAPPLGVTASPDTVSTGESVTLDFTNRVGETLSVDFYSGSRKLNSSSYQATSDSLTVTPLDTWFSGSATSMQVFARVSDSLGRSADSNAFTFNRVALSVNASPTSLYANSNITLTFTNRLGQTLNVDFYAGNTKLNPTTYTAASDTFVTKCPPEWITSGNSVNITARVSDSLGRTATSNAFTLNAISGGTVTAISPTGDLSGSGSIKFEWSYSGPGTQKSALLEISYDQNNWETLPTNISDATTYTASAYRFRKGRLYWRVTVTNSYGLTAQAQNSVTITYDTLSVAATPQSVWANLDSIMLAFTNRLGRKVEIGWYSNNIRLNPTGEATSSDWTYTTPSEDWFNKAGVTGNSMSVQARVSDDLGREAISGNVTVKKPQGMTASPVSPRSTTMDGAGEIPFTWSASGDGTIASSELRWGTNGVDWTDLATANNGETVYRAPAVKFPAGTIYWQVMVTNSFGMPGAWSSSAQFTVKYAAVSQVVPVNSPTSGNISASIAETFTVALEANGPVFSPFVVQEATFYWRSNEMGSFTAVAMTPSGNTASVTIPAGTFESGTLEWYAEATDTTGRTTRTDTFTLTALVASIEAVPLSPINTVEAGNAPITFRWRYASLDGSPQTRADLQYSTDGSTWTQFGTAYGTDTGFTAPADTFPGRSIRWRVRAYNADDIAGPWSSSVSFVVVGATVITAVDGDGKPFLTVSWQTLDQLAYEVRIDGEIFGPYRDESARRLQVREPLEDGIHDIAVRAQNRYGLWSAWKEAQTSVQNVPGRAVYIDQAIDSSTGEPLVTPGAAALSIAGPSVNVILEQPQDVQTTDLELAEMSVMLGDTLQYFGTLQKKAPGGTAWSTARLFSGSVTVAQPIKITVKLEDILNGAELETLNGFAFRFKFGGDAGDAISREAVFTYADPYKRSPQITGFFPPETGYYLIYRDGVLIGKTYGGRYTDKTARPGEHTYYVIQAIKNGYYTKSNSLTLSTEVRCPMLALLSGGEFLALELSAEADRSQTITKGGEVVYVQYSGAEFPEAEVGEAESLTVTGDGSFTAEQEAEARRFESMLKKAVIYKTPGGEVVVGVLQGFTRRDPKFFKSYGFTVTQMEWRDFTNA